MMYKTYEFVCQMTAAEALERIKRFFSKYGVKYRADDVSVTSTHIPVALFSFDRRLYSQSNWTRLNPFNLVTGVNVRCEPDDNGLTRVIVRVNRIQAILTVAGWMTLSLLLASEMPLLIAALFFVGSASAAWFVVVSFLGGYLIKKEIGDHLMITEYQNRWYILGVRAGSWFMSWRKSRTKTE